MKLDLLNQKKRKKKGVSIPHRHSVPVMESLSRHIAGLRINRRHAEDRFCGSRRASSVERDINVAFFRRTKTKQALSHTGSALTVVEMEMSWGGGNGDVSGGGDGDGMGGGGGGNGDVSGGGDGDGFGGVGGG